MFSTDFVPVPCCFPTCNSVTYAYIDGEQSDAAPAHSQSGRLSRLHFESRYAGLERKSDARFEGLWSSSAVLGSEKVGDEFSFSCSACGLPDGGWT